MPLLGVLVQSEKQIALSSIWIRIADSISFDYNRYTEYAS